MYILLGKSRILRKFISLGLFLLQDTAGSTAFVGEYPKYSSDSGSEMAHTLTRKGISQIIGKITQSSSKMAKFAIPAQETPKSLGQYCVLIEKQSRFFCSQPFSNTETQRMTISQITSISYAVHIKFFPRAGNSCKFLHNILYCLVDCISTIVKYL